MVQPPEPIGKPSRHRFGHADGEQAPLPSPRIETRHGAVESRRERALSSRLQQAGLLTAIPFVLLIGPALGFYLGTALDHRWSHAPWGTGGGIVLGLFASARVTIQLIQQARETTERSSDDA